MPIIERINPPCGWCGQDQPTAEHLLDHRVGHAWHHGLSAKSQVTAPQD